MYFVLGYQQPNSKKFEAQRERTHPGFVRLQQKNDSEFGGECDPLNLRITAL
jgi:hypothetical protein